MQFILMGGHKIKWNLNKNQLNAQCRFTAAKALQLNELVGMRMHIRLVWGERQQHYSHFDYYFSAVIKNHDIKEYFYGLIILFEFFSSHQIRSNGWWSIDWQFN